MASGQARYTIVPHQGVPELNNQALSLARGAFAGYAGVTLPTRGKVSWYLARPRMRRDLSMGALTSDGMLVSSVYITLERVQLGGALRPVALVDTVMTSPEHRQRGLARGTLQAALNAARSAGAAAALLFTVPHSMPYRFYQTLGFEQVASMEVMARPPLLRAPVSDSRTTCCRGASELMAFWNQAFASYDGYVPLDEPLWRWRREQRPAELPSETRVWLHQGAIGAAANCCLAPVIGADARTVVMTDLAWLPDDEGLLGALALQSDAPADAEVRVLVGENDTALGEMLLKAGFDEAAREAAMLAPLSALAEGLLGGSHRPWYPLAESIIGL